MMRSYVLAGFVLLSAACGGDSTGPDDDDPPFPAVAGTYNLTATFDELPPADANVTGSIIINQPSREVGNLTGTADITLEIVGDVSHQVFTISSATVTPAGTVSFTLTEASDATWTFSGTVTGTTWSGRHTLSDGVDSFSGDFTATRSGASGDRVSLARHEVRGAGLGIRALAQMLGAH